MAKSNNIFPVIVLLLIMVVNTVDVDALCWVNHTCITAGNFPQCDDYCMSHFFHCSYDHIGKLAELWPCQFGLVFDTNPNNPYCTLPLNCSIPTTPAPDCLSSYTCTQVGAFAKCPNACNPNYYYCAITSGAGQEMTCPTNYTFDYSTLKCVLMANCV